LTILNFVPMSAFNNRGVVSGSTPVVPPTINSCSKRSLADLCGAVCHAATTATSLLMLPIQLRPARSKRTDCGFQFLISNMLRITRAMTEPSLAAALEM
jgi:hypothetical protein